MVNTKSDQLKLITNKDNIAKCSHRIRSISNKLKRETERINTLGTLELIKWLETTTGIRNIELMVDTDQLRHLSIILLSQSTNHDMSIAMCKCAKDLEISIPEDIESPDQFHKHVLAQIEQKRK
jgi:hypothetical protein